MTSDATKLEPEQEQLLATLCEAHQSIAKGERCDFRYAPSLVRVSGHQPREVWIDAIRRGQSMLFKGRMISKMEDIPRELDHDVIFHPGLPEDSLDTYQEDIDALSLRDLIRFRGPDYFFITPLGFDYHRRTRKPTVRTEEHTMSPAAGFAETQTGNVTTSPDTLRVIVAEESDNSLDERRLCDLWSGAFGGSLSTSRESNETITLTWVGMDSVKLISEGERGVLDRQVKGCGGDAVLEILNSEGEALYQLVPETHFTASTTVKVVGKASMQQAAPNVDILLLSVTEVERDAILAVMQPWPGTDVILEGAVSETTYRFGLFGRYRAAHVESTMGTQGRHGVTLKARAALEELRPKAMLLLGIAFGVNRAKQRLGDVIVAETVQPYAYERVGPKVIPRGIEISCGIDLSERFRTRRREWEVRYGQRKVAVFQGQMLSGPKLIDDKEFRDALVSTYPEAKGGEMEGEGGYAAAEHARVQTILIKSICDWADGHKNDRAQAFAAFTAVSLAEHVLSQPDVLDVLGARDVVAIDEGGETIAGGLLTNHADRGQDSDANPQNAPESGQPKQQVAVSERGQVHGDVTQIGNIGGNVHIGKKQD